MHDKPRIENAPGLVWRRREGYWVAMWRARRDLIARGWMPKSLPLWRGNPPDLTERTILFIQETCQNFQAEMLTWGRGGIPVMAAYDGTLRALIYCYQTDKHSTYHGVRFRTRRNYDNLCRQIDREHGAVRLAEVKAKTILAWYQEWTAEGRITQAHSLVTMLRIILKFGKLILECPDCQRVSGLLHDMRFAGTPARKTILTPEQVTAIRAAAHHLGLHSVALAQALQFEMMLRQRDVIGEWVPLNEKGISDIQYGQDKWLRGLRWSEVDDNLVIRHNTSKKGKDLQFDMKLAPMIADELCQLPSIPKAGPIIVCEETGLPWTDSKFRRAWRKAADLAGVPSGVWNMDSRAGAISEGRKAGADLESLRHAATHSDIATTTRYSRDEAETVAKVMRLRAENRKRTP